MIFVDHIERFRDGCIGAGIEVPKPVTRGLELIDVARSTIDRTPVNILELRDDQVAEQVTDMAIRVHDGELMWATKGMTPGIEAFIEETIAAIREATLPLLEEMVEASRPAFDQVAAPLVDAAQRFGFTSETRAEDVIDLDDDDAIHAWRNTRPAWQKLGPFFRFRRLISETFDVTPTLGEARGSNWANIGRTVVDVDYSVAFAAGDNWSLDGTAYLDGRAEGSIDWLALATQGLRLNTPEEARAKVYARTHATHVEPA